MEVTSQQFHDGNDAILSQVTVVAKTLSFRDFSLYVFSWYSRMDKDFKTKFALYASLNTWHEACNKKILVPNRSSSLFVRQTHKYLAQCHFGPDGYSCYLRMDEDFNMKFALNVSRKMWHEAYDKKLLARNRILSLFVRQNHDFEAQT